jgi:hypothetical protein
LDFLIGFYSYNIFFRPEAAVLQLRILPYILAVTAVCWLAGFLTFLVKLKSAKAASRSEPQPRRCPVCGNALPGAVNFCEKCGAPMAGAQYPAQRR